MNTPAISRFLSFYDDQSRMHTTAKVLIGVSAAIAVLTILGSLYSRFYLKSTAATVLSSVPGSLIVLTAVPFSIYLLRKGYWNDPVFQQDQSQAILDCLDTEGYPQMQAKYQHIRETHGPVSNKMIKEHISTKQYAQCSTLAEFEKSRTCPLASLEKDGIISKMTSQLLTQRASGPVYQFLNPEGYHFLNAEVIRLLKGGYIKSDTILCNGQSLIDIFAAEAPHYSFPVYRSHYSLKMQKLLLTCKIATHSQISSFYQKGFEQQGCAYMLETVNCDYAKWNITTQQVADHFTREIMPLTLFAILNLYRKGTLQKLMEKGIAPKELLREKFIAQSTPLDFISAVERLNLWAFLKSGVINIEDIKDKAIGLLKQKSFYRYICDCPDFWKLFTYDIFDSNNEEIISSFNIYLRTNCNPVTYRGDYNNAKKFGLIRSKEVIVYVQKLFSKLDEISSKYNAKLSKLKSKHEKALKKIDTEKSAQKLKFESKSSKLRSKMTKQKDKIEKLDERYYVMRFGLSKSLTERLHLLKEIESKKEAVSEKLKKTTSSYYNNESQNESSSLKFSRQRWDVDSKYESERRELSTANNNSEKKISDKWKAFQLKHLQVSI